MARRRLVLVAIALATIGVNAAAAGPAIHRLPYALAGLTVLFLMQSFWEDRNSRWLTGSVTVVMMAMVASITFSLAVAPRPSDQRAAAGPETSSAPTTTAAITPTSVAPPATATPDRVETRVAGAVEERPIAEQIARCETALAQIAAVVRAAGGTVDDSAPTTDIPAETRLRGCEVRLDAIAATLPR